MARGGGSWVRVVVAVLLVTVMAIPIGEMSGGMHGVPSIPSGSRQSGTMSKYVSAVADRSLVPVISSPGLTVANWSIPDLDWGDIYDPANGEIYVGINLNVGVTGGLEGFNITSGRMVGFYTTTMGLNGVADPQSMVYDPLNGMIYVEDPGTNSTWVFNPVNNSFVGRIHPSNPAYGDIDLVNSQDAMDTLNGELFRHVQSSTDGVEVFDPNSNSSVATLPVPDVYAVEYSRWNNVVLALQTGPANGVTEINPITLALTSYPAATYGIQGRDLLYDPLNGLSYAVAPEGSPIISCTYGGQPVLVGFNSSTMAIQSQSCIERQGGLLGANLLLGHGGDIVVSNSNTHNVSIYDPATNNWTGDVQLPSAVGSAEGSTFASRNQGVYVIGGGTPGWLSQIEPSAPTLNSVAVTPSPSFTVTPSATQNLRAQALDQYGDDYPNATYMWQSNPAPLGSLSSNTGSSVNFTAGATTGSGTVCTNATYSGQGPVMGCVVAYVSSSVTLNTTTISPDPISAGTNSSVGLTAAAYDQHGGPLSGTNFSWSPPYPSGIGSVTPINTSGVTLMTGSRAESGHLCENATYGVTTLMACAAIDVFGVSHNLSSTFIQPNPISTPPSGSETINATALDQNGGVLNGASFTWAQPVPTSLGTITPTTGGSVNFAAGSSIGTGHVCENASLGGAIVMGCAGVAVTASTFAITFVTSPASCGSITLGSNTYANGATAIVAAGSYTVSMTSCSGYKAQSLSGTGGVQVSGSTATVSGSGSLVATFIPTGSSLSVTVSATLTTLPIQSTTTITATASGGSGSYSYSWSGLPTGPGCAPGNVYQVVCTPMTSGTYTVAVQVSDGSSGAAAARLPLNVSTFSLSTQFAGTQSDLYIFGSDSTYLGEPTGQTSGNPLLDYPQANYLYGFLVNPTESPISRVLVSTGGGAPHTPVNTDRSLVFETLIWATAYVLVGGPANIENWEAWQAAVNSTVSTEWQQEAGIYSAEVLDLATVILPVINDLSSWDGSNVANAVESFTGLTDDIASGYSTLQQDFPQSAAAIEGTLQQYGIVSSSSYSTFEVISGLSSLPSTTAESVAETLYEEAFGTTAPSGAPAIFKSFIINLAGSLGQNLANEGFTTVYSELEARFGSSVSESVGSSLGGDLASDILGDDIPMALATAIISSYIMPMASALQEEVNLETMLSLEFSPLLSTLPTLVSAGDANIGSGLPSLNISEEVYLQTAWWFSQNYGITTNETLFCFFNPSECQSIEAQDLADKTAQEGWAVLLATDIGNAQTATTSLLQGSTYSATMLNSPSGVAATDFTPATSRLGGLQAVTIQFSGTTNSTVMAGTENLYWAGRESGSYSKSLTYELGGSTVEVLYGPEAGEILATSNTNCNVSIKSYSANGIDSLVSTRVGPSEFAGVLVEGSRTATLGDPRNQLVFEEDGLPVGSPWVVRENGTNLFSTGSNIAVTGLPEGSFAWSATQVGGLTPYPSSGAAVLSNGTIIVHIHFANTGFLGLPGSEGYVIVVVVMLVVVAIAILFLRKRREKSSSSEKIGLSEAHEGKAARTEPSPDKSQGTEREPPPDHKKGTRRRSRR